MAALIWCPFPDSASARAVADRLIEERLVACANLIGPFQSLFMWQGVRSEGEETGALFKTDAGLLARAVERLEELHPYDAPAIMGWHCDTPGTASRAWLGELDKEHGNGGD